MQLQVFFFFFFKEEFRFHWTSRIKKFPPNSGNVKKCVLVKLPRLGRRIQVKKTLQGVKGKLRTQRMRKTYKYQDTGLCWRRKYTRDS